MRWQYGDIVPDYLLGQYTAALFLSLRSARSMPCPIPVCTAAAVGVGAVSFSVIASRRNLLAMPAHRA